jgi:hypothetical protein
MISFSGITVTPNAVFHMVWSEVEFHPNPHLCCSSIIQLMTVLNVGCYQCL